MPLLRSTVILALSLLSSANLLPFTLRYTADPAPLVIGSRVYLYTTHDITNQRGYTMYDYSLISSTDLLNWLDHGIIFDARNVSWGERGAWAQQTIGPINGGDGHGGSCVDCFYMFWPNVVSSSRNGSVGVALSRSPTGPFVDVTPGGIPLMPGDDPTVYRETLSGAVFLCSNHYFTPLCGRLGADMLSWDVPPRNISGLPHWFEAPWLMQAPPLPPPLVPQHPKDLPSSPPPPPPPPAAAPPAYIMSYECPSRLDPPNSTFPIGHYGLDICQASCNGSACPLDGWSFLPDAELMWSPPVGAGNNHGGLFQLAGRWFYAYHSGALGTLRGVQSLSLQRSVALDAAYVTPLGPSSGPGPSSSIFLPVTATPDWLQQLAWVDPYGEGGVPAALTAGASDGADTRPSSTPVSSRQQQQQQMQPGDVRVMALPKGGWMRVAGVDFGLTGVTSQNLTVRGVVDGGGGGGGGGGGVTIEFSLDLQGASPVATCTLGPTWATVPCQPPTAGHMTPPLLSGIHDVFLTASGGAVAMEWWGAFGGKADSPPPSLPVITCESVRARGTGLFLDAPLTPSGYVTASAATTQGVGTAWALMDNRDGSWALRSIALGTYLCIPLDGKGGSAAATAAATSPAQACARLYLQPTNDQSRTTTYALYPGTLALGRGMLALQVDADSRVLYRGATDPRLASNDSARFDFNCTPRRF